VGDELGEALGLETVELLGSELGNTLGPALGTEVGLPLCPTLDEALGSTRCRVWYIAGGPAVAWRWTMYLGRYWALVQQRKTEIHTGSSITHSYILDRHYFTSSLLILVLL
jgi:hypothetical protein